MTGRRLVCALILGALAVFAGCGRGRDPSAGRLKPYFLKERHYLARSPEEALAAKRRISISAARDGRRPARSVVFLAPDAEELGALGSRFYLEHPLFPLSGVLAEINIDEIGREDAERPGLRDFVHLYLSRNGREDLASVRDKALEWSASPLRVEPRENYSGSDHAFFEEMLIPAVAFSTGQPRDHHLPTDTPDKLDYRNVRDVARLAFAMAWEIAFGERPVERIVSD